MFYSWEKLLTGAAPASFPCGVRTRVGSLSDASDLLAAEVRESLLGSTASYSCALRVSPMLK
jgi:hypothetical protein